MSVCLTYPHTHTVSHCFAYSVMELMRHGPRIDHVEPERCYPGDDLAQGRNRAVRRFLDGTDAEWLLTLDTDMGFDYRVVDRMLATAEQSGALVVSGLYRIQLEQGWDHTLGVPHSLTTRIMAGWWSGKPDGSLRLMAQAPAEPTWIDVAGSGCLLIHRDALHALGCDWFSIAKAPAGNNMGEDISFCHRLSIARIPMILEPAARFIHQKDAWI